MEFEIGSDRANFLFTNGASKCKRFFYYKYSHFYPFSKCKLFTSKINTKYNIVFTFQKYLSKT
jgi:hypothetical protein